MHWITFGEGNQHSEYSSSRLAACSQYSSRRNEQKVELGVIGLEYAHHHAHARDKQLRCAAHVLEVTIR
jgi:hypothetical protein